VHAELMNVSEKPIMAYEVEVDAAAEHGTGRLLLQREWGGCPGPGLRLTMTSQGIGRGGLRRTALEMLGPS
jgi:hypothetical protein